VLFSILVGSSKLRANETKLRDWTLSSKPRRYLNWSEQNQLHWELYRSSWKKKRSMSSQSFELYNFQVPKHKSNIARISLADNIEIDQSRLLRSALLTTLQPARQEHEPHLVPTRHHLTTKQTHPTNGYGWRINTRRRPCKEINPHLSYIPFQTLEQKSYIAQKIATDIKATILLSRTQKFDNPNTISCLSTSKIDRSVFLRSTLLTYTQPVRQWQLPHPVPTRHQPEKIQNTVPTK